MSTYDIEDFISDSEDEATRFSRIKKNIEEGYSYDLDNYKTYNEWRSYVYNSTLDEGKRTVLRALNRPIIEFNSSEVYLSKMVGEWAQHEPSINVSRAEGAPQIPLEVVHFLDGYCRHLLNEGNKNYFSTDVYEEMISGGYSVAKVYTDYEHEMSMRQRIFFEKCYDPTLCYADPMARARHRGDGNFCGELYPMAIEDFVAQFELDSERVSSLLRTTDNMGPFRWTYKSSQQQTYVLVACHYYKKKKKIKIVELSNGEIMPLTVYNKKIKEWDNILNPYRIEVPPSIIGKPRTTVIDEVYQVYLWKHGILKERKTNYSFLPLVWFDGNSKILSKQPQGGDSYLKCRPVLYQARGIQDLKNCAGQTLANCLENMVQHKWKVKKEAIPQEENYLKALINPQYFSVLVVNAFKDNNPDQPIPDPISEVIPTPAPPEVMNTFAAADQMMQAILGGFSSNLGKDDVDLSGKAIIEIQSAGNSSVMPYVANFLMSLTQVFTIVLDLIPKYLKGQREIPIQDISGKTNYVPVNGGPGQINLNYDPKAVHICITPALSFQVQKTQALNQMTALMRSSEGMSQFLNSDYGLPVVVKNMTCHGSDELQEAVPKWLESRNQQAQTQMQMQAQMMQNDPRRIAAQAQAMKAQAEIQKTQIDNQIKINQMQRSAEEHAGDLQVKIAEVGVKHVQAQADMFKAQAEMEIAKMDVASRISDDETSRIIHSLDAASKMADIEARGVEHALKVHKASLDEVKLNHSILEKNKEILKMVADKKVDSTEGEEEV